MSKILVTGATGTIGRQVTLALANAGADVRAAVRDLAKAQDLADAGAELVELRWDDPASIHAAFAGAKRLFLLTPFIEEPSAMVDAALAAAREAGVEHVVRLSAAGADPSSDFALAREHGRNEDAVKHSGIGWTILQPNFFMDNLVNYGPAQTIKAEGRIYGAAGDGKASWVSSTDVGAAAAAVLLQPEAHAGQTYQLTGEESVSTSEIATLLGDHLGREVVYVDMTLEQQRGALAQQGTPAWMVDAFVGLENVKRSGWAAEVSPAVRQLVGRPPETLRAYVKRNLEAFR